jgi:hypothetical protein
MSEFAGTFMAVGEGPVSSYSRNKSSGRGQPNAVWFCSHISHYCQLFVLQLHCSLRVAHQALLWQVDALPNVPYEMLLQRPVHPVA